MSEVHIARGLEGIIVSDSPLSKVDGLKGQLLIRGYEIKDLALHTSFEEVTYLLWFGHLPNQIELDELNSKLIQNRKLPYQVFSLIDAIATQIHMEPMGALRTAVSALAIDSMDPNDRSSTAELKRAIHIVACLPTIVAAYHRIRTGLPPLEPREDLSHAANFLWMLTGKEPEPMSIEALNSYLVCTCDHGMNASTFTSRIIVSTHSDLYSAVTAAVGSLKGLLHGGAPSAVLEMFENIGSPDQVEAWIHSELNAGRRIMGIGHRVYKVRDPRAKVLADLSEKVAEETGNHKTLELAKTVEQLAEGILRQRKPDKKLYVNVEFYTATLLSILGIPADLFTCVFGIGRSSGWMAHAMEQLKNNRLIRPRNHYTGPEGLQWKPIAER